MHLKELVALQDCLGAHQDAVVAMARLGDLARHRAASGGSPQELATLAALVRLEREAMAARRREFGELGPRLFELAGCHRPIPRVKVGRALRARHRRPEGAARAQGARKRGSEIRAHLTAAGRSV